MTDYDFGTQDRRVEKTRSSLFHSLLDLMREKSYDKITVQDILDRANVGRSTFYSHYADKDDLLVGRMTFSFPLEKTEASRGRLIPTVFGLFEHFAEHLWLFRAMKGTDGWAMIIGIVKNVFAQQFRQALDELESQGDCLSIPAEWLAPMLASTLTSYSTDWLEQGMPTLPREAAEFFHGFISQGLTRSSG